MMHIPVDKLRDVFDGQHVEALTAGSMQWGTKFEWPECEQFFVRQDERDGLLLFLQETDVTPFFTIDWSDSTVYHILAVFRLLNLDRRN